MSDGFFDTYFFIRGGIFIFPRLVTLEIFFWVAVIAFVLLTLLSKTPFFGAIHRKLFLYFDGIAHMVATKDTSWSQPPDWTASKITKEGSKRIVFIRHGESVWNELFNKGFGPSFFPRLAKAFVREMAMYPSPRSIILDTPLNALGIKQARDLAEFLNNSSPNQSDPALRDILACLRGDTPEDSLIVSSNLRRALATVGIALKGRLDRTNEKILIHSACQEMSRNVDCVATSPPGGIPDMSGPDCGDAGKFMSTNGKYVPEDVFNPALNGGQKPINERGLDRILNFADWVFTRPEHTIIVGGHSLWFRQFFKAFLSRIDSHPASTCKMENGSCVAFTLNVGKGPQGPVQWIEPGSIVQVFGGFVQPKKKKAKAD